VLVAALLLLLLLLLKRSACAAGVPGWSPSAAAAAASYCQLHMEGQQGNPATSRQHKSLSTILFYICDFILHL
jgi:hypothetical protein